MSRAPASRQPLGDLDARTAARLVEAAGDLSLVLDSDGTVIDLIARDPELARLGPAEWIGKPWVQIVTPESREKVTALLHDAEAGPQPTRWRQLNHPLRGTADLPIAYTALRLPEGPRRPRRIVAIGRDLRPAVAQQLRLVEAQQAMERDYWRFREAETRYRNLLQTAPDAVLIVDLQSMKVIEANPAAETLCAAVRQRLAGAPFAALFDAGGAGALAGVVAAARTVGARESIRLSLADGQPVSLAATAFRQDDASFLLVRLAPVLATDRRSRSAALAAADDAALLRGFVDASPDGIVFTDGHGRVLAANRAFATLAQLPAEEQARGQLLDRWIGRTGVELGVMIGNLRQRGSTSLFSTTLRGEVGATTDVEIAAAVLAPGSAPTLAFVVRDVGRRLQPVAPSEGGAKLPRSVDELSELVGRVPLKDIVTETTDVIEQMAILTALRMTNDNRASAAQLLGLSRQSLYVKLRRFGLGEQGGEEG